MRIKMNTALQKPDNEYTKLVYLDEKLRPSRTQFAYYFAGNTRGNR